MFVFGVHVVLLYHLTHFVDDSSGLMLHAILDRLVVRTSCDQKQGRRVVTCVSHLEAAYYLQELVVLA